MDKAKSHVTQLRFHLNFAEIIGVLALKEGKFSSSSFYRIQYNFALFWYSNIHLPISMLHSK